VPLRDRERPAAACQQTGSELTSVTPPQRRKTSMTSEFRPPLTPAPLLQIWQIWPPATAS